MRTTIQIAEDQRARLLALAAERGYKGCGKIVEEAVAFYLAEKERAAAPPPLVTVEDHTTRAPETRADKLWTVIGWLYEEAAGIVGRARCWSDRLRRARATQVN